MGKKTSMSSNSFLASVIGAVVVSFWACSGSDSHDGGSNSSGGAPAIQGGAVALGGATPVVGGTVTAGGRSAVGGSATAGGNSATAGGNGAGGALGTGGRVMAGAKATGGAAAGGATATGGTTGDAYATYRQQCVDTINSFRATLGLAALVAWPAINTCVDGESTTDETAKSAHSAFGRCGESAQDECLGSNNTSGLVACLTSMWNEKNNAACSGCEACSGAYWKTCANCDYSTCGHYVNMSAHYYTQVSCGFSSLGGWSTQDFK